MRRARPVTVTLGEMQSRVDARVRAGTYASASEVLRAGLRALDREEAALDELIREKVREAITDPRPSVSAADVFADLRAYAGRAVERDV